MIPRQHLINRMLYRAGKRGMKENELVLKRVGVLVSFEKKPMLNSFERLLEEEDSDINRWILGQAEFPAEYVESGLADLIKKTIYPPKKIQNCTSK